MKGSELGFGFRVSGLGSRVSGLGSRVSGLGPRVLRLGFRVQGSGCMRGPRRGFMRPWFRVHAGFRVGAIREASSLRAKRFRPLSHFEGRLLREQTAPLRRALLWV